MKYKYCPKCAEGFISFERCPDCHLELVDKNELCDEIKSRIKKSNRMKRKDALKYSLTGLFVLALIVPFNNQTLIGLYFEIIINGFFEMYEIFAQDISVWVKILLLIIVLFVFGVGAGFSKAIEATFSFVQLPRTGKWTRIKVIIPVSIFLLYNAFAFYIYFTHEISR